MTIRIIAAAIFRVAVLAAAGTIACGSPGIPTDDGHTTDAVDALQDSAPLEPTVVDENFRIMYGYASNTGTNPGEMLIGNPAAAAATGAESWKNDFRIVEQSLDAIGLDCTLGCSPNRDLSLIAVSVPTDSGALGMSIQVVALDAGLGAAALLDVPLSDIRQAYLSDRRLVYSKVRTDCESGSGNPKTCFSFEKIDFGTDSTEPMPMFVFPPASLLEDSLYSGRFRVGGDGSTLIVQYLTIDSLTFWLYGDDEGLRQAGDRICQTTGTDGLCSYSGNAPALTDDMPVALTADNGTLILAWVAATLGSSQDLTLARIDVLDGSMAVTRLLHTTNSYDTNACYNITEDWKYTRIQQPILVTPDGKEAIFVAASECDMRAGKSLTNVLAVPIENIGTVEKAGAGFFRGITDFKAGDLPENVSILPDCLDISDSGKFVLFGGTPMLDSTGNPILDDSPQHYSDREAFVTAMDGRHMPVQISGDSRYKISWLACSANDPGFAETTDPETADE